MQDLARAKNMQYCLWMNMPSHHQRDFIQAFTDMGIDLEVRYFGRVDERRQNMGWDSNPELKAKEKYFPSCLDGPDSLEKYLPDWKKRTHIIPGMIGNKFLMRLVDRLIREGVYWVHWSEDVKPGLSRLIRLPFRKLYGNKINRYALGAMAVSKSAENEFISWGIKPKKIAWLPYATDPLGESAKENTQIKMLAQDNFVFMFCGALCHRKGTDLLLRAFQRIVKEYMQVVLILMGPDTKEQYYRAYSDKLGIDDNKLLFLGTLSHDQAQNALCLCDVCILPSRYDGWGMVIFEGASLGKAIVATDRCGAANHLIVDGLNGFVVRHDNIDELSNAMGKYLNNKQLAKSHGACSKILSQFYHPHRNVERFLSAIESFIQAQEQY